MAPRATARFLLALTASSVVWTALLACLGWTAAAGLCAAGGVCSLVAALVLWRWVMPWWWGIAAAGALFDRRRK